MSADFANFIESVHVLPACLLVVVKQLGIRNYFFAAHLPRALREDCLQVWQEFGEQLGARLDAMRYHGVLLGGADLNLEVYADSQEGGGGEACAAGRPRSESCIIHVPTMH